MLASGGMALHHRILLGLGAGALVGIAVNLVAGDAPWVATLVTYGPEPIGKMWLSALIMVVIPLIVSTLSTGVVGLGDIRRLGRIGVVTIACFLTLTVLSTLLGLTVMNVVAPGGDLDPEVKLRLLDTYRGQTEASMGLSQSAFSIDLLTKIVPRNPLAAAANGDMLAVIFFSLVLGIGMVVLPRERAEPLVRVLESLGHVTVAIIGLIMHLAPYGVFCLIFSVTARFGFGLLVSLASFTVTVLLTLAFFQVVGYGLILRLVAGRSPLDFFRRTRLVMITAFTTSSSNATLPTSILTAENELGVEPEIAGFVLPLGATMNMNGTALFEGATVLFLAQVFGVDLSLSAQLLVVLMSVLTAIGTAGIPGGSIPLLMMVLAMVGVPPEGIAVILGIDRLLDMCRTVLNVTGDLVTATVVQRFAGRSAPT